jgi:hypothetical protein
MRWILCLIALSAVLPACSGPDRLATPRITAPYGSVDDQQKWAQYHEPYPENDLGPPIAGARPREYEDPRSSFTVLRDTHPPPVTAPRSADPILAPYPQSPVPQAPMDQPQIVTPPTGIYYPPGVTPP